MLTKLVLLGLAGLFTAHATDHKSNYRVAKLSTQSLAVSCYNGQPPEVRKVGEAILLISCAAE